MAEPVVVEEEAPANIELGAIDAMEVEEERPTEQGPESMDLEE